MNDSQQHKCLNLQTRKLEMKIVIRSASIQFVCIYCNNRSLSEMDFSMTLPCPFSPSTPCRLVKANTTGNWSINLHILPKYKPSKRQKSKMICTNLFHINHKAAYPRYTPVQQLNALRFSRENNLPKYYQQPKRATAK